MLDRKQEACCSTIAMRFLVESALEMKVMDVQPTREKTKRGDRYELQRLVTRTKGDSAKTCGGAAQ